MPFVHYTKNYERRESVDKTPLFLIPGISGDSSELTALATSLHADNPNQPIYIWHDSRLRSRRHVSPKTINQLSIEISSAITKIIKNKNENNSNSTTPTYKILGYSFGVPIAVNVTALLKKETCQVDLCLLDAPSPDLSKKHFVSGNLSATRDLESIIRFAGKLSELPELNPNISEEQMLTWSNSENIEDQLKHIYSAFCDIQNIDEMDIDSSANFLRYFQLIKQNIIALKNCDLPVKILADNLLVITSKETQNKYNCSTLTGWQPSSTTKFSVHSRNEKHVDLPTCDDDQFLNVINKHFFPGYVRAKKAITFAYPRPFIPFHLTKLDSITPGSPSFDNISLSPCPSSQSSTSSSDDEMDSNRSTPSPRHCHLSELKSISDTNIRFEQNKTEEKPKQKEVSPRVSQIGHWGGQRRTSNLKDYLPESNQNTRTI